MNWFLVAPNTISVPLKTTVIQRSQRTNERRSTFETRLYVLKHMMHYGIVGIGRPKQYFKLIFDTGSSVIWVTNEERDARIQMVQNSYDPDYSGTHAHSGKPYCTTYGNYEAHGYIATDIFEILGRSFYSPFGVVNNVTGYVEQLNFIDGLFGLAPGPMQEHFLDTPLDLMYSQGLLTKRVFTFMFDKDKHSGTLVFGEVPSSLTTGLVNWVSKVNHFEVKNHWAVRLQRMFFGNGLGLTTELIAAVDTGTFVTVLPKQFFNVFVSNFQATFVQDKITVPCHRIYTLPKLVLHFGEFELFWYPQRYVIEIAEGVCWLAFGIMPPDMPVDVVLGMAFLKDYATIFDGEGGQVGFAQPM